MSIFAEMPLISDFFGKAGSPSAHVNVKFQNGNKCVSLILDNSNGQNDKLVRGSIRLLTTTEYVDGDSMTLDLTASVFSDLVDDSGQLDATLENIDRAMKWLRRSNWGFEK